MSSWWHEECGATAVEYALMLAAIAAVIVAAVTFLGNSTSDAICGVSEEWADYDERVEPPDC